MKSYVFACFFSQEKDLQAHMSMLMLADHVPTLVPGWRVDADVNLGTKKRVPIPGPWELISHTLANHEEMSSYDCFKVKKQFLNFVMDF